MIGQTLPGKTNFQALSNRVQEEAFTLAYYLLEDETLALVSVEAAFAALARAGNVRAANLRADALREVIARSRAQSGHSGRGRGKDRLARQLQMLPLEVRAAAVLVDVLGLDYAEAAQALGVPNTRVAQLLARARRALSVSLPEAYPSQTGAPVSTQP